MNRKQVDIHSGSRFDDFLEEEGMQEEVVSAAIKRVLAWQLEQEMARQQMTKRAMATELKTSRSQLDRLLDPENTAVSLDALARAAHVLGKRLVIEMKDRGQATSAPRKSPVRFGTRKVTAKTARPAKRARSQAG